MARDFGRLSHIFNRVDKLSPQKRRLLAATLSGAESRIDRDVLASFYDGLPASNSGPPESARFLTYAPFAEVLPGFSWILFLGAPHLCPEHTAAGLKAQLTMRDALFRQVDFAACRNVLDFGCGYGSDLIRLAERYPHLQLDGYTISPRQAEIAR